MLLVSGYAAIFNNLDSVGDIIRPGALDNFLVRYDGGLPLLWDHNRGSAIGIVNALEVNRKGLIAGATVFDESKCEEMLRYKKNGLKLGMSIGYKPRKSIDLDLPSDRALKDFYVSNKNPTFVAHRELLDIDLVEISITLFPANELALIKTVKERK